MNGGQATFGAAPSQRPGAIAGNGGAEGAMMKLGRRSVSTHPMPRIALMLLVAMTLAFSAACRADDAAAVSDPAAAAVPAAPAPDAAATPPAPDAAPPRARHHEPARHLTVAQSIDQSVHRLARGLALDPGQQVRLRQILVDQHRQIMQLRSSGSAASGDVAGTTLAIYDQTRARIRAMLNEEQRKKYPAAVPRDQTAPAQADLQHWMQIQESRRKQDDGAAQ
jgi:hypothetical protein